MVETIKCSIFSNSRSWDGTFNLGTGIQTKIIDVAKNVVNFFNHNIDIRISGDFRIGDIRHNFADIQKINKLGINSKEFIPFEEGYKRFLNWAKETGSTSFNVEEASRIMKDSGMYHES